MAESMIEKVARAIYEKRNGHGCRPWGRQPSAHKAPYLDDARTAIQAMQEPSLEMLEVGHDAARAVRTSGIGGQTIENSIRMKVARESAAWRAMIDAALNEEVAG